MTSEFLQRNWALLAALGLLCVVAVTLLATQLKGSRRARLVALYGDVATCRREVSRATRNLRSRQRKVEKLGARIARVRPRHFDEAQGHYADAKALLKIAEDRRMVAENQLRKFICEEFPPARHDALRRRYLPGDVEDGRPFTF